jgi:hypothetical protein
MAAAISMAVARARGGGITDYEEHREVATSLISCVPDSTYEPPPTLTAAAIFGPSPARGAAAGR